MSFITIARACLLALLMAAGQVMAVPIHVVLSGLSFQEGGTIVDGSSFTLDLAAQTVTNVDITTTTGTVNAGGAFPPTFLYPGQHYSTFSPGFSCFNCVGQIPGGTVDDIVLGFVSDTFSGVELGLQFRRTPTGVALVYGDDHSVEDYGPGGHRYLVAPNPVPEPAMGAFLLAGLAVAAAVAIRRRQG